MVPFSDFDGVCSGFRRIFVDNRISVDENRNLCDKCRVGEYFKLENQTMSVIGKANSKKIVLNVKQTDVLCSI